MKATSQQNRNATIRSRHLPPDQEQHGHSASVSSFRRAPAAKPGAEAAGHARQSSSSTLPSPATCPSVPPVSMCPKALPFFSFIDFVTTHAKTSLCAAFLHCRRGKQRPRHAICRTSLTVPDSRTTSCSLCPAFVP
jgi:hypothetical protein